MINIRSFLSTILVLASASVTLAAPSLTTSDGLVARSGQSINPPIALANVVERHASDTRIEARYLTNGERLARGLPLNRPHRRATPVAPGASAPSATSYSGYISIKASDGHDYGYVKRSFNTFGEYGTFTPSITDDTLKVTFTYYTDGRTIDILATNGPSSTFPYVGGAVGYASDGDDFGPGTYNYAYVSGTKQTPSGSPPIVGDSSFGTATGIPADYESAIWLFNPSTNGLTAQWINTDGSAPQTHILYADDGNDAFLLTGDPQTLRDTFGTTYPAVTLTFVSE